MNTITTLEELKKEFNQICSALPGFPSYASVSSLLTRGNILPSGQIGFMDIETTGLNSDLDNITIIGLHSYEGTNIYVDKHNHKKACQDIDSYTYLVTFNGNRFDIPFVHSHYGLKQKFKSIDLMYLFWQIGYYGGLKEIERQLGLTRMGLVKDMQGKEAVELWHKYKQGDKEALNKLISYNIEDIINLEVLFNFILHKANGCSLSFNELRQNKRTIINRIKENKNLHIWM